MINHRSKEQDQGKLANKIIKKGALFLTIILLNQIFSMMIKIMRKMTMMMRTVYTMRMRVQCKRNPKSKMISQVNKMIYPQLQLLKQLLIMREDHFQCILSNN